MSTYAYPTKNDFADVITAADWLNWQTRLIAAAFPVYVNTADSSAIANTASETAFSTSFQFPANTLTAGMVVRVRAWGLWSVLSATTPTLTLKVRFNAAGTSYVATFGALTAASGQTNRYWALEAEAIVRAVGASGSQVGRGRAWSLTAATPGAPTAESESYVTAPTTIDTTVAQTVQVTATWSAANAANTATLQGLVIEAMG